jgi:hypothetical protein
VRVGLNIVGNIVEQMREVSADGERAVSRAMAEAGTGLKNDWRGQILGAGLGTRLARTIRSAVYPKGMDSLNAATMVWTNAPKAIGAFERGALIRSKNGFYLAIPTPAAGAKGVGNKRITPGGWEQRTGLRLRFIYRRGAPSLLVAESRLNTKGRAVASRSKTGRGVATVPIFILVPQVNLRKRLDLARDGEAWANRVPGLIVSNWKEGT